jgi:plasmid stabilization system protein ParE
MKLVIAAEARRDLCSIGDYIARDNPRRALSFVEELEKHCLMITDRPLAYPLVPRHEASGIRRAVHGRYNIFYTCTADAVQILHILNGAMNYEAALFGAADS